MKLWLLPLGFTGLVFGTIWVYAQHTEADLFVLTPNQMGDFVAGVGNVLALIWLVFGYYIQTQELKLQRKELRDQNAELRRTADVQDQQWRSQKRAMEAAPLFVRAEIEEKKEARRAGIAIFLRNKGAPAGMVSAESKGHEAEFGIPGQRLTRSWDYDVEARVDLLPIRMKEHPPIDFDLLIYDLFGSAKRVSYRLESRKGPLVVLREEYYGQNRLDMALDSDRR